MAQNQNDALMILAKATIARGPMKSNNKSNASSSSPRPEGHDGVESSSSQTSKPGPSVATPPWKATLNEAITPPAAKKKRSHSTVEGDEEAQVTPSNEAKRLRPSQIGNGGSGHDLRVMGVTQGSLHGPSKYEMSMGQCQTAPSGNKMLSNSRSHGGPQWAGMSGKAVPNLTGYTSLNELEPQSTPNPVPVRDPRTSEDAFMNNRTTQVLQYQAPAVTKPTVVSQVASTGDIPAQVVKVEEANQVNHLPQVAGRAANEEQLERASRPAANEYQGPAIDGLLDDWLKRGGVAPPVNEAQMGSTNASPPPPPPPTVQPNQQLPPRVLQQAPQQPQQQIFSGYFRNGRYRQRRGHAHDPELQVTRQGRVYVDGIRVVPLEQVQEYLDIVLEKLK